MKYFALLTLSCYFFMSCSDESSSEPEIAEEEYSLDQNETDSIETEEVLEEVPEDPKNDSLISLMNDLEQRRLDMYAQLEDAKPSLFKMQYDYQSDYDSETSTWYFTEDFQPLFYFSDFAAEGGYWTNEFYVLTDGQVSFAYYMEDEGGSPKKYYHYINTFEGGEDLVAVKNKRIDEVVGYKDVYFVPEVRDYELSYFEWIKEFKAEDYVSGAVFVNDQKEEQESVYGGTTNTGATVSIDSVLYQHFYK